MTESFDHICLIMKYKMNIDNVLYTNTTQTRWRGRQMTMMFIFK